MISPDKVSAPVKVGVTAAIAAAAYAGSKTTRSTLTKDGILLAGAVATLAYVKWAFFTKKS